MEAKYFDGKSSKPYSVVVKQQMNGLKITSKDKEGDISRYWPIADVTSESFSTGNKVLLSYGDFPHERIELNGEEAFDYLDLVKEQESKVKSIYHFITTVEPVRLVFGSATILIFVIYSYIFHISPWVGEQAVKILPLSLEQKAGELMYQNMDYLVDRDSVKSVLLKEFFEECGFESPYNIRIDYANEDMVNAFAIPGGQIVVYEGLIKSTQSWDELAALMGHELAHVNQRHSFKQIARSVSSYFLLSVLTGDVAGASSIVLDNAAQVYQLSNSRTHETEADIVGLQYLKERNIRPLAMYDLFKRLQDESLELEEKIEDRVDIDIEKSMEYFQTHPATSNRMEYIKELIENDSTYQYTPVTYPRAEEIWNQLKIYDGEQNDENIFDQVKDKIENEK